MHALRWHAARDIRLETVPEPGVFPDTAVVEVAFAGICGTDVHEYLHGPTMIRSSPHPLSGQSPPVTLGHELSGRVAGLDGTDDRFAVGTRVAIDPCLRCGTCFWCLRGQYHICTAGGSVGLASDGGFARYVRVPVSCLNSVPDSVSDEFAALAEPLAVGLHAADQAAVSAGSSVLVLGAGPIGLAAILGAVAAGATRIFVSEPNPRRAAGARSAGATEVFDPLRFDVRREVFSRTGRVGPDSVIDGTGRPEAIALGLRTLRRGGHMSIAGISDQDLQVDLRQLVLYERTLSGSLGSNFDISRVLSLIAAGRLDPAPMLTAVRPLSAGPASFAELSEATHSQVKILLNPREP